MHNEMPESQHRSPCDPHTHLKAKLHGQPLRSLNSFPGSPCHHPNEYAVSTCVF